jgi:hypothetical protein
VDERVFRLQRGRQRVGIGVAQVGEVAAECGVGQDEQVGALDAGVGDQFGDARQVELQVAAEVGGRGRDPDAGYTITASPVS